jgi:GR25 family glycosyltransferase involved in LPS biosynthesis
MSPPLDWNEILSAPAFIINLARRPDRYQTAHQRIQEAGFTQIQRIDAVDAQTADLTTEWNQHRSPLFDSWDQKFRTLPGKQGVMLSMLKTWKNIIDHQIPYATIFEDDVLFHPEWDMLASLYYEDTPKDFDVVFYGNQLDAPSYKMIDQVPTYCLHAYGITLEGAQKIYDLFTKRSGGVYTIDCMFNHTMRERPTPYTYYIWNGVPYAPKEAYSQNPYWRVRNTGLVFQDENLGTDIGL